MWLKIATDRSAPIWRRESPSPNSPMGASWSATLGTSRCSWCAEGPTFSRSELTAPTTMGRSWMGSSLTRPCGVLGTTPVLTFELARPYAPRHSARPNSWSVEQRDGEVFVREKRVQPGSKPRAKIGGFESNKIVIVGGGAAGFAAVEMLRRQEYQGEIMMLSADDALPVDRPNLSKDYLAGSAPEEWVPLRDASFYSDNDIDLRLDASVVQIDPRSHQIGLANGETIPFDQLLLATGAEPVRPSIPGAKQSDVLLLRSLADCHAIIERAKTARRAVVLGASFIGLEVAAALRAREIEVHVVGT